MCCQIDMLKINCEILLPARGSFVGVGEIFYPGDHFGSRQTIALGTVRVIYLEVSSYLLWGWGLQTLDV